MLVNSKQMLMDAKEGKYSVPAPDFIDLDSARVFVKTADELGKPIVLSYAEAFEDFLSLEEAAEIGKFLANSVKTPICLHLDHGVTMAKIKRAIDLGFTSVMIDASTESFEENVRLTKEVVEYAKAFNVTVEAEIGHVGQNDAESAGECSDSVGGSVYTTSEEAKKFAELTGVDSLAVSIGTAHGIYKGLTNPELNFERLEELERDVQVPLVLHGGSGTGDANLNRCATSGIAKINIYSDFLVSAFEKIKSNSPKNYHEMKSLANKGMKETLKHYFEVFSNNK